MTPEETLEHPRMKRIRFYWLLVTFLVTFTAGLIGMYWNMLETRMTIPNGTKMMLLIAFAMASISHAVGRSPAKETITIVGIAVPAGAFVGMLTRMLHDPTYGGLWPIAVFALGVAALVAASAGALVGRFLLWLSRSISGFRSS